jgi:hypothetical protein
MLPGMRRALAVAVLVGFALGTPGARGESAGAGASVPATAAAPASLPDLRRLEIPPLPESAPRTASYLIHVELDPRRHTLVGRETITWRNPAPVPAAALWLHLYLNAFKHSRTSFMREREREGLATPRAGEWGWIDLRRVEAQGRDLAAALRFARPDDGNPDDDTVVRVDLPEPVPPGGQVVVKVDFEATLPRALLRTGHAGPDFHLVAQWFPKLGVFSRDGWRCHQMHQDSEFFADFGQYDVWITVPLGYTVAATGELADRPTPLQQGRVAFHYQQADVHDFAFLVARGLHDLRRTYVAAEHRDAAAEARLRAAGVPAADVPLSDVEVRLLLPGDHLGQADRAFAAAFAALTDYGYAYGRYPYPTLTLVDPPAHATAVAGMEYPTFVVGQSSWLARGPEEGPEHTLVHEIAHQYFYGLLASDEVEEPWLDEGFAVYASARLVDRRYGEIPLLTSFDGLPLAVRPLIPARRRLPLYALWRDAPFVSFARGASVPLLWLWNDDELASDRADRLRRPAYGYQSSGSYFAQAYYRTAHLLRTLEGLLGEARMARVMRVYAARYRFRHPRSGDFRHVLSEAGDPAAVALWDQVLARRGVLDYAVGSLRSEAVVPRGHDAPAAPEGFESEVVVERTGELRAPVEVEVRFAGGARVVERWDGADEWRRFRYRRPERLDAVRVDPRGRLALDRLAGNNVRTLAPDHRPTVRFGARVLLWLQHVLAFAGGAA